MLYKGILFFILQVFCSETENIQMFSPLEMICILCYSHFLDANEEIIRRHYAKHDEGFFVYCDKELLKVNTFFAGELSFCMIFIAVLIVGIVSCGAESLWVLKYSLKFLIVFSNL